MWKIKKRNNDYDNYIIYNDQLGMWFMSEYEDDAKWLCDILNKNTEA